MIISGKMSEAHDGELKKVVNELSLSVSDLDKRIDLLASRLSPVIRNMPSPESAPEMGKEESPSSPLGMLLMEKAAYVRALEQRLATLLDALAI